MKQILTGFTALIAHAGTLIRLLLTRIAVCLLIGATLNGLLVYLKFGDLLAAWQAGHWLGVAGSALALPLVLVSMLAYAVFGYRQGLGAAMDHSFRVLSGPLLDLVAERASALLQQGSGSRAERLAALPARLKELNERVQGQRWIVRKVAALLLNRLPFAELLSRPEVSERLQAIQESTSLTALIRQELDQIELPGLGWWPVVALVAVHLVLMWFFV